VRGQSPEEPRSEKPLPALPSPEELGVSVPKPANWCELRIRLDRLGASEFQLKPNDGGWHFTCKLRDGRTLEGRGATDADAVIQAIERNN
jgi:hypothetical protein